MTQIRPLPKGTGGTLSAPCHCLKYFRVKCKLPSMLCEAFHDMALLAFPGSCSSFAHRAGFIPKDYLEFSKHAYDVTYRASTSAVAFVSLPFLFLLG